MNGDGMVTEILKLWNEGLMPETIAEKLGIDDVEVVEDTIEAPGNYALEVATFR